MYEVNVNVFFCSVVAAENGQVQQQKHIIRINQDGQVLQAPQKMMVVVQGGGESSLSATEHVSSPAVKQTFVSVRVSIISQASCLVW